VRKTPTARGNRIISVSNISKYSLNYHTFEEMLLNILNSIFTFWVFEMDTIIFGNNAHTLFAYCKHDEHSLMAETVFSAKKTGPTFSTSRIVNFLEEFRFSRFS
jgi:hypothetical protein